MKSITASGEAKKKIVMTGDTKDAKNFYAAKKKEFEENIQFELSFIDSLYMMHTLRKKIQKAQAEAMAFDNIKQYSHNFGDFVFYKSMNFRSHYLETIAEDKNKEMTLKVRKQAAEYFIECLFLQYNTRLYNCEKYYHEMIHFRLFNEFIVPLFDGKMYDQYLVILMVRSLANVILRRVWVQLLLLRQKTIQEEINARQQ
jgi:methyltransferase-like protein